MPAEPQSDVQDFYSFLGQHIQVGVSAKTSEELLNDWRRKCENDETVAAVKQGMLDAETGKMRPLRELLAGARARAEPAR